MGYKAQDEDESALAHINPSIHLCNHPSKQKKIYSDERPLEWKTEGDSPLHYRGLCCGCSCHHQHLMLV